MIRFVDLRGQITDDFTHFAFFDTIRERFVDIGGEQAWYSLEDLMVLQIPMDIENTNLVNRCASLIPKDYFNPPTVIQLTEQELVRGEDLHMALEKLSQPPITIEQAYSIISSLVPDNASISIDMACWWHSFSGNPRAVMETKFSIYVSGRSNVYGATLDAAVQAFICASQPSALPEEIDALITETTPPIHTKETS